MNRFDVHVSKHTKGWAAMDICSAADEKVWICAQMCAAMRVSVCEKKMQHLWAKTENKRNYFSQTHN